MHPSIATSVIHSKTNKTHLLDTTLSTTTRSLHIAESVKPNKRTHGHLLALAPLWSSPMPPYVGYCCVCVLLLLFSGTFFYAPGTMTTGLILVIGQSKKQQQEPCARADGMKYLERTHTHTHTRSMADDGLRICVRTFLPPPLSLRLLIPPPPRPRQHLFLSATMLRTSLRYSATN